MRVQQFIIGPNEHCIDLRVRWMFISELVDMNPNDYGPLVHLATWVKRVASDAQRRADRTNALMKASGCTPCVRKVLDEAIDGWWVAGEEGVEIACIQTREQFRISAELRNAWKPPIVVAEKTAAPDTISLLRRFLQDAAVEIIEVKEW